MTDTKTKPCPVCRTERDHKGGGPYPSSYGPCRPCERADRIVKDDVIHIASNMVSQFSAYPVECLLSQTVYVPVHDETHEEGPEFASEDDAQEWVDDIPSVRRVGFTIEERQNEALEHWIVSDWLGRKLAAEGEIVGELFDFTIWGRQTSGQAIACDGVIIDIAKECMA